MRTFPESDWKALSRLKLLALERLCARILQGAQERIAAAREGESLRAYLDLYGYLHKQDKTLSRCFDDWRRSNAFFLLANWRAEGLLTDEEFAAFREEIRQAAEFLRRGE